MMKLSYYPGCSLKGTARDYEESLKAVCSVMDLELCELEDWNCCGATAAHSLDHQTGINLPGRNIALAEEGGLDMLVPCPLCYNRLKTAEKALTGDRKSRYDVGIRGDRIKIWDLSNFLAQDPILHEISSKIQVRLKGLRAVCYYGCMASRPPKVTGETLYENPMSMDRILECLGVEVIPWSYKTDCCGAGHLVARPDIVFDLVGRLYRAANRAGANCMVVSCQMCQANLDLHQEEILKRMAADYSLPIFYFTELVGLAFSHKDTDKWFKRHFVDPGMLIGT